jgi:hypothetical protein
MIRSRHLTMIVAFFAALALTLLSAVPVQAQAVTQSNLEGRLDKIRQGQRNARIAVDVMVAKWLLTPPDFPSGGPIDGDGNWKNTKNKTFAPPANGQAGKTERGGFLPASLGVARTDEFDTPLGYCARGKGGIDAKSPIVYAVIWPCQWRRLCRLRLAQLHPRQCRSPDRSGRGQRCPPGARHRRGRDRRTAIRRRHGSSLALERHALGGCVGFGGSGRRRRS